MRKGKKIVLSPTETLSTRETVESVYCETWHSTDFQSSEIIISIANTVKIREQLSRNTTKPTKWLCAQRRLSSAWATAKDLLRVAKDPSFLHADSKDSDQTGRMPRLIWVFTGHTCHFVKPHFEKVGARQDLPCPSVILWFSHSVTFQMNIFRHTYLRTCEA